MSGPSLFLPMLSYIVNMLTKILTVFASYFGIDVKLPKPETTTAPQE